MKRFLFAACMVLIFSTYVLADDVDTSLGDAVSEQLKASTRATIQAGMDSEDAVHMTAIMQQNRFTQELAIRAQEIIRKGLQDGLPYDPIMNKAMEGMAKQVQHQNIVEAMEKTRARYAYSYQKAGQLADSKQLRQQLGNTIAQAMTAGLAQGDVDRIMQRLQTRDMTRDQLCDLAQESFTTLREMTRLGVDSETGSDVICQALEHQYLSREMRMLRQTFMEQARYGNPDEVAKNYSNAIGQGRSAQSLGLSSSGASGSGVGGAATGSHGTGGSSQSGSGSSGQSGSGGSGSGGKGGKP